MQGQSQHFTITPDFGYQINDVLIDGVSVGAVPEYTFENVLADHTITASFSALTSIALNKPATSQSTPSSLFPASKANDDDVLSFWYGLPYPQWWKVDLGNVYDITGIALRNYVDGKRYYQYTIEASTDDITYTAIASKTSTSPATSGGDLYTVAATARYLRVTTTYNSSNTGVHICDFRAYGVLNGGSKGTSFEKGEIFPKSLSETNEMGEIGLNIYPNPFADLMVIELSADTDDLFSATIYDMAGKIVYFEKDMPCNVPNFIDLRVSDGMYVLSIKHMNKIVNKQIIKLK